MSKIKIIHLIDHLGSGGAQEIIRDLLYNINKEEFDQEVVSFFDRDKYSQEFESKGFKVHHLNLGSYNKTNIILGIINPRTYYQLTKIFKGKKIDIINIHLYFSLVTGIIFNLLVARKKLVYTMHAMKNQVNSFFSLFKLFSPFIDKIIADIEEIKTEFETIGIKSEKIVTINFATNFYELPPATKNIRQEFNIDENQPLILNIARLHKQKGQKYLIDAFSKIEKELPEARLIIVGDGEEYDNFTKLIADLKLSDKIFLTGFRKDILNFLDAADVFVIPSINEGLGMITLQAMSRKKPIIAFKTGALERLVVNNETGFLVPTKNTDQLAERVKELLKNDPLRKKIGENCLEIIKKNFSLKNFAKQYEREYKQLTQK